jgi:hypothetical protein
MSTLPHNQQADAREFYRQQLGAAFRYSRHFAEPHHVFAERIVDTPECEAILRECAPGSLDCARRIGDKMLVLLDRAAAEPWWRDLLNYERAWFMQLATTLEGPPTNRPRRGVSATCINFGWNMPVLVKRLEAAQPVAGELRGAVTLVFARGTEGRVFVAEVSPEIERVFRAANGLRTADQIAVAAGVSGEDANKILKSLASIGAMVLPMSPDEMMRLIEKK